MTDEKIIDLYFERDERAITETDSKYGKYFRYIAFSILKDNDDAKEITNDTYMRAWSVIPPKRPDPLKTFLGKITRRLSINRLETRLAKKRGGGEYDLIYDELSEVIAEEKDSSPDEAISLRDAINEFLSSLSMDERAIFICRYWYMHSVKEISLKLSFSESKIKMSLLRSRIKLKDKLLKEGFEI